MLGRVVCGSRTWICTMAAPALAASIEDRAISSGVTGTAGFLGGGSAEPVTAHETITLRCIRALLQTSHRDIVDEPRASESRRDQEADRAILRRRNRLQRIGVARFKIVHHEDR